MADLGNISKIQLVNGDVAHFQDLVSGYTKNTGTITGIKMNGSSKGTSGVVDLGTVITAHQDISGKADKSATVSTIAWDSTNSKLTKTINGTTTDVVTIATIKSALALPDPMVFKGSLGTGGTITSLPTAAASNKGYTYKVITAGTYASQAAKVGDTFISDGSSWVLIPSGDEPSGTVTSVGIANGGAISVSGSPVTSSGTITISHADTSSQASSSNSGRTYIQSVTLDTYGHVTGLSTATETVTNTWRGIQDNLTSSTNTSESLSAKQGYLLANGSARDNTKLPLTGGTVTGTVTFGSSVSMDEATVGDLVVNGAASCTNNLQVNTINGVTVGSSPKFTDNNTTYSAGTGLSLSGTTFSVKTGYTTSGNNRAVQADSNGNLYVVQKDDNITYSAGTGLSLSSTTFAVKLGYTTSGNNRAVQADSSGNLYVTQKDDNTTYSTMSSSEIKTGTATTQRVMTASELRSGLLNLFYPVGSYYETSDTAFNPNTSWGGTWVLETEGLVHISSGTTYKVSGATTDTKDGGSKDATLVSHSHTVDSHTHHIPGLSGVAYDAGWHTHSFTRSGSAGSGSNRYSVQTSSPASTYSTDGGGTHSHTVGTNESDTWGASPGTNAQGSSGTDANMMPYIIVNRWHRTA